jgi:2'-5' RNA ligase
MKRTFIAIRIEPGEKFIALVEELKESLSGSGIRWVSTENIHLTLAFIGNTTDSEISEIKQILHLSCRNYGSFQLVLQNINLFKSFKDPRVLYLDIRYSETLHKLRSTICNNLIKAGLYKDTRPFKPHLTLGRPKFISDAEILSGIINSRKNDIIQSSVVDKIGYYESILQQEGPVYMLIEEFDLIGK